MSDNEIKSLLRSIKNWLIYLSVLLTSTILTVTIYYFRAEIFSEEANPNINEFIAILALVGIVTYIAHVATSSGKESPEEQNDN